MSRFAPLRHRNFRAVLVGQAVSGLGTGLVAVALAFAVLRLTGSATDLGLVLTADFGAQLVLYVVGGTIADRLSRRQVMIGADTARCLSQAVLGALLLETHPSLSVIVVLVVVQGLAGGLFTPAAQGLTPALVTTDDLPGANVLSSMVGSLTGIFGPALGGVLVATIGPGWAIVADSATFAVNAVMLARVSIPLPERAPGSSFLAEMTEGWREFWARRWYAVICIWAAVLNAFVVGFFVLGPVVARRYYGGAEAWGWTSASGGVGSTLGGLAVIRWRPRRPLVASVPLTMLFGLAPLAFAARLPLPILCVASAVGLFGPLISNSLIYTTVQQLVPEQLLSRLFAYDYFFAFLFLPVGTGLAGPAGDTFGVLPTLFVLGLVQLVGPLALLLVPSIRRLEVHGSDGRDTPAAVPA